MIFVFNKHFQRPTRGGRFCNCVTSFSIFPALRGLLYSILATPTASYRTPELEFPKTAAETAGETAGETRGAGGTAAGTAGRTALSLRSRETEVTAAVPAAVPPAPRVSPAVSPAVSAAVLGNSSSGVL